MPALPVLWPPKQVVVAPAVNARPAFVKPMSTKRIDAIQRKVGFEFETNFPIWHNGRAIIGKNDVLFRSNSKDWYITSDAGCIEFVTEAFEEQGLFPEKQRMSKAVEEMAEFMEALHLSAQFNKISDQDTDFGEFAADQGTVLREKIYIPTKEMSVHPVTAKPQVTGGIKLSNVSRLFKASMNTQLPLHSLINPSEVQFLGEQPQYRKTTEKTPLGGDANEASRLSKSMGLAETYIENARDPSVAGWDKLEGILALVYSYLLSGAQQERVIDQAKYLVPLMSRMSFSAMLKMLPEKVKQAFNPETSVATQKRPPVAT